MKRYVSTHDHLDDLLKDKANGLLDDIHTFFLGWPEH